MNHIQRQDKPDIQVLSLPSRAPWTYDVDLVFLVGSPRSGSTWLQAMIASHPAIYTGTETLFFMTFAPAEKSYRRPTVRRIGLPEYLSNEDFYNFMGDLFWRGISRLPTPTARPKYFLEKTNSHCLHADFILKTFPNARFIHIIRDCRAVVSSLLQASKSWAEDWANDWGTVDKAMKEWITHVRAGQRIAHKTKNSEQYIEVKYEDLRESPYQEMSKLFDWLQLPADESLVNSIIKLNSIDNVREAKTPYASIPMTHERAATSKADTAYPEGFVGPAPYNGGSFQLRRLQRLRVEQVAGDLLRELGYAEVKSRFSIWERIATSARVRRMLRLPQL